MSSVRVTSTSVPTAASAAGTTLISTLGCQATGTTSCSATALAASRSEAVVESTGRVVVLAVVQRGFLGKLAMGGCTGTTATVSAQHRSMESAHTVPPERATATGCATRP